MTPAYIGLGSNLEEPLRQLRQALQALAVLPASVLERCAGVYRSRALGPSGQPDYLNSVARLATALSPEALLDALQAIERNQGRRRDVRWGPRTLDLDLLLYGDLQINTARLTIPHPGMHARDFVLYPLLEISDTNLVLPGGAAVETLLRHCPGNDLVRTEQSLWTGGQAGTGEAWERRRGDDR